MSEDEVKSLSLLLEQHGVHIVAAALAVVCNRLATNAAEESDSALAADWSYNADLFRSLSGLVTEPQPARK